MNRLILNLLNQNAEHGLYVELATVNMEICLDLRLHRR